MDINKINQDDNGSNLSKINTVANSDKKVVNVWIYIVIVIILFCLGIFIFAGYAIYKTLQRNVLNVELTDEADDSNLEQLKEKYKLNFVPDSNSADDVNENPINVKEIQIEARDHELMVAGDQLKYVLEKYFEIFGYYPKTDNLSELWSMDNKLLTQEIELPIECGSLNQMSKDCGVSYVGDGKEYRIDINYFLIESETLTNGWPVWVNDLDTVGNKLKDALAVYYRNNGFYPAMDNIWYLWKGTKNVLDQEPKLPVECGNINNVGRRCGIEYYSDDNQYFTIEINEYKGSDKLLFQD
jgi:hypothetical protein